MMRHIVFFLCLCAAVAAFSPPARACIGDIAKNRASAAYYDALRKKCNGDSCCLAGLASMEENGWPEAKNGQCPEGIKTDMLKCPSTLVWCRMPTYAVTDCLDGFTAPAPPSGVEKTK